MQMHKTLNKITKDFCMQSIMLQVILWVKKYASHSNHLFFMSCNKQALSTVHCDRFPSTKFSLPQSLTVDRVPSRNLSAWANDREVTTTDKSLTFLHRIVAL